MNSLLTAIINDVYTETNRPDLVAETKQSVLSATLTMHMYDTFYKDIVTGQVDFTVAANLQTLDTTLIPLYRKINYVRLNPQDDAFLQSDPLTGLTPRYRTQPFLQIIAPDDILDDYHTEKRNVAYQAGFTLFIKSGVAISSILMGWYAYPNLTDDNYTSWIAREQPYAIIYHATAKLLNTIGQEQAASKYDRPENAQGQAGGLVQEQIRLLKLTNIVAETGA